MDQPLVNVVRSIGAEGARTFWEAEFHRAMAANCGDDCARAAGIADEAVIEWAKRWTGVTSVFGSDPPSILSADSRSF